MSTKKIRRALQSGNRHERAVAAIELGRLSDKESAPELKRQLDDSDDLIAVSSMYGCWLLGDESVKTERAVSALASQDEETVQPAVQALCEMGKAIVPDLVGQLEAGSPHSAEIVRILGDIGGDEGLKAVKKAARTADRKLAETARGVLEDWDEEDRDPE